LVDELNPTGYAQVLEELTLNAQLSTLNVFRTYTYGHDLLSQDQLIDTGTQLIWQASFYGYDGHGSVRYLTDGTGALTDTYDYDAFGNLIAQSGPTPNLYLYSGEQFDPDLGLYYLRARYHNPQTGRFWTADEFEGFAGDPASLHRYTYAANNPVNWIDPSGNITLPELSTALSIRLQLGASVVSEGLITGARALATAQLLRLRYAMLDAAIEGNDALLATLQDFYGLALLANGQVNEQLDQAERLLAVANLTLAAYHAVHLIRHAPELLRQAQAAVSRLLRGGGSTVSRLESAVAQVEGLAATRVQVTAQLSRRLDRLGYDTATRDAILAAVAEGRQIIVVGESMKRVGAVERMVANAGGEVRTYNPRNFTGLSRNSLEANRSWLRYWVKDRGAVVIDIGRQRTPRPGGPSPFYWMENNMLNQWDIPTPFDYGQRPRLRWQ
jgi:RHS repeat-associated protein